jgi:hypothetical protein
MCAQLFALLAVALPAQLPSVAREEALDITNRANFVFETHAQPKYVRLATIGRQDGFLAYITGNVATFGEFAGLNPGDFHVALRRDGDAVAIRESEQIFPGR